LPIVQGNEVVNPEMSVTKTTKSIIDNFTGLYSKKVIEYDIKDYKDDLFVSFPMGLNISLYLYELLLYPIVLTNNTKVNKVKRFTVFIENCSDKKIQHFFSYITKEIRLNKDNPSTTIYIPILPIFRDDVYIKLLIKFSDAQRINLIRCKTYIIKIEVKRSIHFDFTETCFNFFSEKNKKIEVNLKTDLCIKNKDELTDLVLKESILNKNYTLLNKKNNETDDDKIHMNYYFGKNNNYVEEAIKDDSDDEEEVKIKKKDYTDMIRTFGSFLYDKDGDNSVNVKNNHIL
jgi:hypothetical protein